MNTRTSWDTSLKHIVRNGLTEDILSKKQIASIPKSNLARWGKEAHDKYSFCELNKAITEEIDLIKQINQSSNQKKVIKAYLKLCNTFNEVLSEVKGIKSTIKKYQETIINTIEEVKEFVPVENAIKVFNISRSTFENYKSIVIHKCEASYFHWCTRRLPHQLLSTEVVTIKKYMENEDYQFWSKSSIFLKAIRDKKLHCGLSTFYKYCRLLGFKNQIRKKKSDDYNPVKTSYPNQLWCADVTIFKTLDGTKNYIHFLMDHYSKMILGFYIGKSPSGIAIKNLLKQANQEFQPKQLQFLTDGGSENVNTDVSSFINQKDIPIEHIIAQKDVAFSNSMIEALNKVFKHQFLHHKQIENTLSLTKHLNNAVTIYNTERPQINLGGNTPLETYNGTLINFQKYTAGIPEQKILRIAKNKQNPCRICY